MKRMLQLTLAVLMLLLAVSVVGAEPLAQDEEVRVYVVQPGEGLIQLARRFYGDGDAFRAIVEATNARAASDSSYSAITDANIILVGQKLIIPGSVDLAALPALDELAAAAPEVAAAVTAVQGAVSRAPASLAGTNWILSTMDGNAPLSNTTISMDFDATSASGTSGCNSYNASYEASGIRISFGPAAGTLRACTDPVMEQEQAFLQVLSDAAFFEITAAGSMRLFNSSLTMLAEFDPASSELGGTSWDVINYNNGREAVVSVIAGTAITADFSEDGQISGVAGCNNYSGTYTTDGDAIAIGPLAATRRACIEDDVMEQEAAYLAALETAATYQITGDLMVMRTAEGAMAANFSLVK